MQALNSYPVMQLCGNDITSKRAIARTTCQLIDCDLYAVNLRNLPQTNQDFQQFLQRWEREVLLNKLVL
jgi:hypothetical protein